MTHRLSATCVPHVIMARLRTEIKSDISRPRVGAGKDNKLPKRINSRSEDGESSSQR